MNWIWLIPTGFGSFIFGYFLCAIFSGHRVKCFQDAYLIKRDENEALRNDIKMLKKIKSCSMTICDDKFNLQ